MLVHCKCLGICAIRNFVAATIINLRLGGIFHATKGMAFSLSSLTSHNHDTGDNWCLQNCLDMCDKTCTMLSEIS